MKLSLITTAAAGACLLSTHVAEAYTPFTSALSIFQAAMACLALCTIPRSQYSDESNLALNRKVIQYKDFIWKDLEIESEPPEISGEMEVEQQLEEHQIDFCPNLNAFPFSEISILLSGGCESF